MELLISIALGVLLVEAYAWVPQISEWLIERFVSQLLAKEDQARCREEWKASLDALPNSLAKLLHALSFVFAPERINADSVEAKLERIGHQLEALSQKHSCTLQEICSLKNSAVAQSQASQELLAHALEKSVASLKTIEVPACHLTGHAANSGLRDVVNAYENVVNEFETLCRLMVVAVNRLHNLTYSQICDLSARIEQVDIQIRTIFAKHADANGLFRKRKLPFTELALVLKNLDENLQTVRVIVEEEVDTGEDDRQREFKTILSALRGVIANYPGNLKYAVPNGPSAEGARTLIA
jgi:hypothetical protein